MDINNDIIINEFEQYDVFICGGRQMLRIPFDKFSKFSLVCLHYLFVVLKASKTDDPESTKILSKSLDMFKRMKETYHVSPHITDIISKFCSIINDKIGEPISLYQELGPIAVKMYYTLLTTLKRIHASIFLARKQYKKMTATYSALSEAINSYEQQFQTQFEMITKEFNQPEFADLHRNESNDAFLSTIDSAQKFLDFLNSKDVHYSKCRFCLKLATYYAWPCGCPLSCADCWKHPNTSSFTCPVCGKSCNSFINTVCK